MSSGTSLPALEDYYDFLASHRQSLSHQRTPEAVPTAKISEEEGTEQRGNVSEKRGASAGRSIASLAADADRTAITSGHIPAERRGTCGVCCNGVFTDHLRLFANDTYYHEECVQTTFSRKADQTANTEKSGTYIAFEGADLGKDEMADCSLKPAMKSTRANSDGSNSHKLLTPTTARIHDDACLPTVRFTDTTMTRGNCGVCEKIVFTDQLRTYSNGSYFHDSCLYTVLSDKLAKLDASVPGEPHAHTGAGHDIDDEAAPLSPTSRAMDLEIARIRRQLEEHLGQTCEGNLNVTDKLHLDLNATLELDSDDSALKSSTPSTTKTLAECCSSLATPKTPRPSSLWQTDNCRDASRPVIRAPSAVSSSGPDCIIPDEFLTGLRHVPHGCDGGDTEGNEEQALVESIHDVRICLSDSAKRVQRQLLSPRTFAEQTEIDHIEDEAKAAALDAVATVLQQTKRAEIVMSDDDLAHVLEELGKITKRWSSDRARLVADVKHLREDNEEMKQVALSACMEASDLVERVKQQAEARQEARQRAKEEKLLLEQKNEMLLQACASMTDKHAATTEKMCCEAKEAKSFMEARLDSKLEAVANMLSRNVVAEASFRVWMDAVRDARLEELASASKDILAQCALKCSAIGEDELRERENLRQELEDLRVQHESERLDMQQQHQSEMAKYRIKMSTLEDTVWQKIERIARRLEAYKLTGGTLRAWADASVGVRAQGALAPAAPAAPAALQAASTGPASTSKHDISTPPLSLVSQAATLQPSTPDSLPVARKLSLPTDLHPASAVGRSKASAASSTASSLLDSSKLFSSDDDKSVTSSGMRSNRSTRSSAVWASRTRVGIGAYFQRSSTDPDALEVKTILPKSPAQMSNQISVGDSIVAVDGELVSGKSLSQLAELILGPPSSSLECCFKSKASQQLYNVSLTRGALLG